MAVVDYDGILQFAGPSINRLGDLAGIDKALLRAKDCRKLSKADSSNLGQLAPSWV